MDSTKFSPEITKLRIVIVLSGLLLLISCHEQRVAKPRALGKDFYPIEIGQYRIYDVEEIQYKLIGFDTIQYQLRETFFDSIVSLDQVSYLIKRDRRDNHGDVWVSDSVWVATPTKHILSINENNIPFIKLTFPVKVGAEWDGNSLNSKGEGTYYYQSLSEAIIDSIAVEDHIRLIIEDIPRNIVNQDERSEIYARGIGLVQKKYLTLGFCAVNCTPLGEIQAGRFLNQILIEIGNE